MAKFFAGSHGVGKSTLLEQIRIFKPHYYTTDGFSRPLRKSLEEYTNVDKLSEQLILNEITCWNYFNLLLHKNVVSTRSIIDAIVYSKVLHPEIDTANLVKKFESTINQIEAVFYVPIEFEIEDDGMRFLDKDLQSEIDWQLKILLTSYQGLNVIEVRGNVKERCEIISSHL